MDAAAVPHRATRWGILVTLLVSCLVARVSAQTELWRYRAPQDIKGLTLTPFGTVLVVTDTALLALDPETGSVAWSYRIRPHLTGRVTVIGLTGIALIEGAAIDLANGQERWTVRDLPLKKWRTRSWASGTPLMLFLGETEQNPLVLVGTDLASGRVAWRSDSLLATLSPRRRGAVNLTLGEAPLADSDTTLIVYLDNGPGYGDGGPVRLHAGTGQTLWRADSTWPRLAPGGTELGYPPTLLTDGRAIVPYLLRLLAFDAATGRILWRLDKDLPSKVAQMEMTPRGLLIRGSTAGGFSGDPFLDLLDPASGASRWPTSVKLDGQSPFLVRGDSVLVPERGKLLTIALADGGVRTAASAKFQGGEQAMVAELRPEGLLLRSSQNLALISDSGVRYNNYYPAPAAFGLFSRLAVVALSTLADVGSQYLQEHAYQPAAPGMDIRPAFARYRASQSATDFTYVFTNAPDSAGHTGNSLVRIRKADGRLAGRVWVGERRPQYELDRLTHTVFLKEGDNEISAHRF
jgi:outer membrane protein assembly factor BamB